MAKSRGRGRGRPKSSARKTKQLSNVKSKGSLVPEEDLSIAPLALSEDEEEIEGVNEDVFRPLSPKSSLTEILRQEEIRHDFSSFIEANHRCSKDIAAGKSTPIPVLRTGASDIKAREDLNNRQEILQTDPLNVVFQQEEKEAREHYAMTHKAYISFLQEKSKVSWIKEGDQNSAFFHSCLRERRRQNKILSIENGDGQRIKDPAAITEAFLKYYQGLLGSKMQAHIRSENMSLSVEKTTADREYKVRDLSQADFGRLEIELTEVEMPDRCSIETLTALGAEVRWCSSNIFSTQDQAAVAIARDSAAVFCLER
ncbi:hypothetical protein F8388_014772 [Cannabis sativa]|uniref:Uncharacterized protein n=1 Tax=Cannabis sativa TaxID=3483 RepID=A0A7J6H135_CANSA|nr:hypothetical protein F8388_014772 [Cannabis sativa]